jgi:phosphoribosylformylglycinamidine cyclo-ligase
VGIVDEKDLIDGSRVKPGDMLIGMASSGVHSNGFSLVRRIFTMNEQSLARYYDELGCSLGEALIAPTKIYVKALRAVKEAGVTVKACSHITGGGFYENVPRMLPKGMRAVIRKDSYPVLPIFRMLMREGNIAEAMMYNTFNMGIGMITAVDAADAERTMEAMRAAGETPYLIGEVEAGEKGVTIC